MERIIIAALLTSCLFLTSCRSSRYESCIAIPEEALEKAVEEVACDPHFVNEEIPTNWWELFQDEQLSSFIVQALANNPTVQIADATIRRAGSNADIVYSNLWPSLTLLGNVQRQKASKTTIDPLLNVPIQSTTPAPLPAGSPPFSFTEYYLAASILYDFDLWGKNRNAYLAAVGEYQATLADAVFIKLGISIAVAETYFAWQINWERQKIAEAKVQVSHALDQLTSQRKQKNLDTSLQTLQTKEEIQNAELELMSLRIDAITLKHRLQYYLANQFDDEIEIFPVENDLLDEVPLPYDLPLHLIARRPDIIAELWLIESKQKQVDVAVAEFYPDFNLLTLVGYNTIHFSQFFKNKSSIFLAQPAFNLPIFTGGQLQGQLALSDANLDLEILRYNDLVLKATQEVLDGIQILQETRKQLKYANEQTSLQEQIYKLNEAKKQGNIISNFEIYTSRLTLLSRQDRAMLYLGNTFESILQLIKSVGGGFRICEDHS